MIDFTRAKNITLNGKDVRQLKIGDTVVWEKWVPESIVLSSDKNVTSAGNTVLLTGTVYDKWGNGCPNENVNFYSLDSVISESTINLSGYIQYTLDSIPEGDTLILDVTNFSGDPRLMAYPNSSPEQGFPCLFFIDDGVTLGSEIKIVHEDSKYNLYIDDELINWVSASLDLLLMVPSNESLALNLIHTRDVLIGSGVTNANGQCSVSYLVQDTNPLNIKANTHNLESSQILIECIYKYVTDFNNWDDSYNNILFSDFILPTNHEIYIKFKNTSPRVQIACVAGNLQWIYAQNLGHNNNGDTSTRNNSNQVITNTYNPFSFANHTEYCIQYTGINLKIFEAGVLKREVSSYDKVGGDRRIRMIGNSDNISYMKIREL